MKSNQPHASWFVQSVTHGDGRRAITLSRDARVNGRQSCAAKAPAAGQRKGGVKLCVQFPGEELSGFPPLV